MPKGVRGFKSGSEWKGNSLGRPKSTLPKKQKTKREQGENDLHSILRRLKPLNTKAILKLEDVLNSDKSSEAGKIKVAAFIMRETQNLINQLYIESIEENVDDDDEDNDDYSGSNIAIFSPTVKVGWWQNRIKKEKDK